MRTGWIHGLFVSVCLQVQENVFVEFNHQELLEFYNKVCWEMERERERERTHACVQFFQYLSWCFCFYFPFDPDWHMTSDQTHLESFCSLCLCQSLHVCVCMCVCVHVCDILWTFFHEHQLKAAIVSSFLSAWNHARPVGFPDLTLVLSVPPFLQCVCACVYMGVCVFLSYDSCEILCLFSFIEIKRSNSALCLFLRDFWHGKCQFPCLFFYIVT